MLNSYASPNTASTPQQRDTWLDVELRAQRKKNNDHAWAVWIFRMVLVGGFLAIWEYAVVRGWVNVFFVSSPSAIAKFLVENIQTTTFWTDTWITLQETLYGFLSAGVCGVLAAFVLAQNRLLRDTLDPILSFLNSLPRVAFAPLFVAFFGLGMFSKVVLAFSLCFFIVLNGTLVGLKSVDPDLEVLTRQLGASRVQHFMKLLIPSSLPSIFSALKLSLIYGFLAVVVGEMIGANAGLGQQIAFYSGMLRTDAVFGLLLVLGFVATLSVECLKKIENFLLRWQ